MARSRDSNRNRPDATPALVSVADSHLDQVDDMAGQLHAVGLDIDQVLGRTGTITGSCPAQTIDTLRRVPGVSAVEPEMRIPLVRTTPRENR